MMYFLQAHLLSLLIGLPLLGAGVVLAFGNDQSAYVGGARWTALLFSFLSLLLCIPLYLGFDTSHYAIQFREQADWIQALHLSYDVGVDGLSLSLVVLSVFTGLLVILSAWHSVKKQISQYFATCLVIQAMTVGVFCALDAILFYLFWEGILIPMYLLIGVWGGKRRSYAAIKFFLYTFLGSALLLVVLLYLGLKAGHFSILGFYPLKLSQTEQILIFLGFFLAFAIKVPMWPVHTWLPDAHTEAPTGGSVILAALLLKLGTYGFLRFSLPITPDASRLLAGAMIVLSLIAIVYVGLVALSQSDMKRLIAYSSIAHMGFVTLGCFLLFPIFERMGSTTGASLGIEGAVVQMIGHAFGSAGLFIGFGMLYDRMKTRLISDFGGVANAMPALSAFFLVFCLNNVGLPGTFGFVGEFMVLIGAMQAQFFVACAAALTLVIAAAYTLWMYKRVFYGSAVHSAVQELSDICGLERFVSILLVAGILGFGLYPRPLLKVLAPYTQQVLVLSTQSKIALSK